MLTKLVHNAFINFQINNFTTCNSADSVFLLLTPPYTLKDNYIAQKCIVSLAELKVFLTRFKKISLKRYKIINNYNEITDIDKKLTFIEELVAQNEDYKKTSLRQIKSSYIRKKELLAKKYTNEHFQVHTVSDLICLFYTEFEQRWSCLTLFNWHQNFPVITQPSLSLNDLASIDLS